MAVGLAVAAAVCFGVAAVMGPDGPSFWLRLGYLVAACAGVVLLIAAVAWAARRPLERLLVDRLTELAGPSLIQAMPPRTVLASLLPWIYGETDHEDVLTGVLGGAGRDLDGSDTAVSRSTTAHFRIWTVEDGVCASEAEWTHELSGVRKSHKFVVFATHDEQIGALVAQQRRFPLFEYFRVLDEDDLGDFIRRVRDQIELGITYTDTSGRVHVVPPRPFAGEVVPLRRFRDYVTLSDDVSPDDLCILQFDLWELADDDHVVQTIDSLTIRATGTPGADLGFYTWSAPHPCFVRTITFDVRDLFPPQGAYEFLVVPFTLTQQALNSGDWTPVHEPIVLQLDSWLLPGHGVTLLWRSAV